MKRSNKTPSLTKNAILNGIKTICSVVFPFLSFSYCSRILGAGNMGNYSFGNSIVAYLSLLAGLGIANYAIRDGSRIRDQKEKLSIFTNQIYTINVLSTIIAYLGLIIIVTINDKISAYSVLIYIQSIQIVLTTIGADWINSIYEDYLYLTIRYILIQIISFVSLILFVKGPNDIYIYAIITVLSTSGGNIVNYVYLKSKKIYPKLTKKLDFKRHILPIVILFANNIASVIYLNSDITMIGFTQSSEQTGIYSAAAKIYSIAKTVINSIIIVTIPRFSYYISHNKYAEYRQKLSSIFQLLIIGAFPISTLLLVESPKILSIIAGNEYISGINILRILSLAIIPSVGACFYSYSVLIPNKKEKKFLYSTITAAVINIVLNAIFIPKFGIIAAAFTTLLAEVVVFAMTLFYANKTIRFKVSILMILKSILGSVIIGALCLFLDSKLNMPEIMAMVCEFCVSLILYLFLFIPDLLKRRNNKC